MRPPDLPSLCQGRYQLLEILGEGGMAVVYKAFDEHLRIHRAIKLLVPAALRLPEARARLETEARAMASLDHPNVVSVFDIRKDDGALFLVMELIPGGTLWDWVRVHGPMPPRMATQLIIQVLSAVGAAHAEGVIHRDLKPQNIMIDARGTPKVTDFGIAHVQGPLSDASFTRTGTVLGTWAFMAPEQRHSARQVDRRTDLYAIGATLYAILTANQPFDLFAADQDARLLAGLPEGLAAIIRRATRYNPTDRYDDALEMVEALVEVMGELDPIPEGTPELGTAPTLQLDQGADTAAFDDAGGPSHTDGPAADLIFGRRSSGHFEADDLAGTPELPLLWKLLITIAPALVAMVAGGAVLLWRGHEAEESPTTSSVVVRGEALTVELIDAQDRSWAPGPLQPGAYRVEARFTDQAPLLPAGEFTLPEGTTLTLTCSERDKRCEVVPPG